MPKRGAHRDAMRASARKLAQAIRQGAAAEHERRGPGRYRAVVERFADTDDFRLDVVGEDLDLDQDDVTLAEELLRTHADTPIDAGDILILVELGELEFSAIAVEER